MQLKNMSVHYRENFIDVPMKPKTLRNSASKSSFSICHIQCCSYINIMSVPAGDVNAHTCDVVCMCVAQGHICDIQGRRCESSNGEGEDLD